MLYKDDNDDRYPYGIRINTPAEYLDPSGWVAQLIRHMGNVTSGQPKALLCTSDPTPNPPAGAPFAVHYRGNRQVLRDVQLTASGPAPLRGSMIPTPALISVHTEKDSGNGLVRGQGEFDNIRNNRNTPNASGKFRSPGMTWHNWGMTSSAADGHVEWLKMPAYNPNAAPPVDLEHLGDILGDDQTGMNYPKNGHQKHFLRQRNGGGGF